MVNCFWHRIRMKKSLDSVEQKLEELEDLMF